MSEQGVALGGGILFLLVAVVGGGFTIQELKIPKVPRWARAAAGVLGLLLILPFMRSSLGTGSSADTAGPTPGSTAPPAASTATGPVVDAEPTTNADHGLRLSQLRASVQSWPAGVGESVTVHYRLTNTSDEHVALENTFVAARDPTDHRGGSPPGHTDVTLAPGRTLDASGSVPLTRTGTWRVWACYRLVSGDYCPEWKDFLVFVE